MWQKYLILIVVGLFAATGNLMTSGISAILPLVQASYHGDPRTSDLATWPAFFMGVGNLLAIPVAHAVGRRPVYLLSTVVLAFGCLWCAKSTSLTSHIIGRDIMSIASGNAEALCPIIVQELFYLHERGKVIAWFCALQTLGTASLIVATSYLANDLGWRWWYGVFGCVNGAIALLSFLFVIETKYHRTTEAISRLGTHHTCSWLTTIHRWRRNRRRRRRPCPSDNHYSSNPGHCQLCCSQFPPRHASVERSCRMAHCYYMLEANVSGSVVSQCYLVDSGVSYLSRVISSTS